jgi:hypothetical protein
MPIGDDARIWNVQFANQMLWIDDNAQVVKLETLMKRPANTPELWDKMLEGVRDIYEPEYVCIAGGAIRDYLLKKEPKDIDIFIKLPDAEYTGEFLLDNANSLALRKPHIVQNEYDQAKLEAVIRGTLSEYTVDLCFMDKGITGEEIVGKFDFGICQHWYDGEIHSTKAGEYGIKTLEWFPLKKIDKVMRNHFNRVNKRHGNIYTLQENEEPWYQKFAGKKKVK